MQDELAVPPGPAQDEVHVWTVPCDGDDALADELWPSLSSTEQRRASRLVMPGDRRSFVIGRARVRHILGAYVHQPAAGLGLVARTGDKPSLAGARPGFDFSFSRCAVVHLCAIASNRPVGVDVELVGTGRDADAIAATYFSAADREWLAARSAAERAAAFADLWVKKEAFVKGVGTGLRAPLADVVVPYTSEGPVLQHGDDPGERAWRVRAFTRSAAGDRTPARAWVAAVAAPGDWRLTVLAWPGRPAPPAA